MAEFEQEVTRRGFLKVAALTAVAAGATGAGAATLKQVSQPATTTIPNAPSALPTLSVPSLSSTNPQAEAFAQLASAQAENMRLQSALDAANRQLATWQQHDSNTMTTNESIQMELASAHERTSLLTGLLALYEQLDTIDLDTVLDDGLTAVSGSITTLIDDIPTLEESIEVGKAALADIENNIPLLESGRAWLDNHTGKLELYFRQIETLLLEVVDAAGPFLQMINEWFSGIKKWLPFGIGEKAATIMHSVTVLLIETPSTISGLSTNIAEPLDIWLAKDDQHEPVLKSKLIKPMRDDVMAKTNEALSKARDIETTYTTSLKQPLETAVATKQTIRDLITTYREQHQI